MKFSYLLIAFFFLILNGCSDFSSESNEFELSGKYYACDGDRYGEIIDDSKLGKKQYCNGYRWIDLVPEDSIVTIRPESKDSTVGDLSESKDSSQIMYECNNGSIVINKNLCSKNPKEYLPLDDSEYPYAGIPRIVIETENFRAIKDRETEIPAKLQIWGENAPESEIMELTIKGRGNTTWGYPKKPYALKFNKKTEFLGMPSAKKWVMLANYRDRSLMRNAIAFEISRRSSLRWTPRGMFVDIFINQTFMGNYFICEKIEISKNRLNLSEDSYLLEFDDHYDKDYKFRTEHRLYPVSINYPKSLNDSQFQYITSYINKIEDELYTTDNNGYIDSLDFRSFAKYLIIFELTQNAELRNPQSAFMYKQQSILHAGPVWDFDWGTFNPKYVGLIHDNSLWYKALLNIKSFRQILVEEWQTHRSLYASIPDYLDSLKNYTKKSNIQNFKRWTLSIDSGIIGDEKLGFDEAMFFLKETYTSRFEELDKKFKSSFINQSNSN